MSRRTRNPFSRVSNFFKQRSGLSHSTSNVDVPSAGPPPILPPQLSAELLSHPSGLTTPLPRSPSQATQPPAPSAAPPSAIPPPPQYPAAYGTVALSPSYDDCSPPTLLLPLPTSGPTPDSSRPPISCVPTPQFNGSSSFAGAHNFIIKDSQFNDFSLVGSGIDKLLKNSMPDAFHNSAARYPPPKCHLGTREEYITKITNWALDESNHHEPILWMRGPFGVGKSAVAQSCAEALQLHNKLAATLFFSRSNADRDDSRRVFTSIAYQIAAVCQPFSNIVDARIRQDPAIATKSLSTQFDELLVRPLTQIDVSRSGIDRCVVIVDGLDECRGSAEQCEIIRVITTSARDRTTPLRWFITSRPEDPIIRTMKSHAITCVSFHLELPVSRKIDHEILLYLTDEFKKIRESHSLPESWPSEEAIALLVNRTAGLWIYASTIIRFITDENSLGPQDQLRIVLKFANEISATIGQDNPLAEMDFFYILIIQRIPHKIRTLVLKILLLHSASGLGPYCLAVTLCLSVEQFRRLCASIQSVMELQNSNFRSTNFRFYHASFLDFMKDPERSKDLSIYGDFLIQGRRKCLDWLYHVCSRSTGSGNITFPSERVLPPGWTPSYYYSVELYCFWRLCSVSNHPFDLRTATLLEKIPFRMMLRLIGKHEWTIAGHHLQSLRDNLPTELRDKIIRLDKCPTPGCTRADDVWILGRGENETVMLHNSDGAFWLRNNQDPHPRWCPCGSPIVVHHRKGS